MAQSIVQRVRGKLASKSDAYFEDVDLLDYINNTKRSIVSAGVKQEIFANKRTGKQIRALNLLRSSEVINWGDMVTGPYRGVYKGSFPAPNGSSSPSFFEQLNLLGNRNGEFVLMTELTPARRDQLELGLLSPVSNQGFYHYDTDISPTPDEIQYVIYVHSNDPDLSVTLVYIKEPVELTDTDEDLIDLPDRLISAVVHGASVEAGMQELRENYTDFEQKYQQELSLHLW